ncbi:hypothetical protein ACFL19_00440 [Pseudomonadota bacterium]
MTGRVKLLLSTIAMLGCLMAASQLHAHESGLHDIDHACISCDLEDVVSHGAVTSAIFSLEMALQESEDVAYASHACTSLLSFSSIRAPPSHS